MRCYPHNTLLIPFDIRIIVYNIYTVTYQPYSRAKPPTPLNIFTKHQTPVKCQSTFYSARTYQITRILRFYYMRSDQVCLCAFDYIFYTMRLFVWCLVPRACGYGAELFISYDVNFDIVYSRARGKYTFYYLFYLLYTCIYLYMMMYTHII